MDELHRALREHGINNVSQVALSVLDVDGSISCLKYDEIKPDANTHLMRRRFLQKKQSFPNLGGWPHSFRVLSERVSQAPRAMIPKTGIIVSDHTYGCLPSRPPDK